MKLLLWGVMGLTSSSCVPLTAIPAPPISEPARQAPGADEDAAPAEWRDGGAPRSEKSERRQRENREDEE